MSENLRHPSRESSTPQSESALASDLCATLSDWAQFDRGSDDIRHMVASYEFALRSLLDSFCHKLLGISAMTRRQHDATCRMQFEELLHHHFRTVVRDLSAQACETGQQSHPPQPGNVRTQDLKTPLGTAANLCEEVLDEFGVELPPEAQKLIAAARAKIFEISDSLDHWQHDAP